MNSCTHLSILSGIFCALMAVTLSGCNAKETVNVEETPVEVIEMEEKTDGNTDDKISLANFDVSKLYCKERKTVCNHYIIDEAGVLWGTGVNDFGQLGIEPVNTDLYEYTEPIKIAEEVLMVDASSNGYFTIYY